MALPRLRFPARAGPQAPVAGMGERRLRFPACARPQAPVAGIGEKAPRTGLTADAAGPGPPLVLTEEACWGSSILISPLAPPIPGPWQLFAFLSCSLAFPGNSNRANGEMLGPQL